MDTTLIYDAPTWLVAIVLLSVGMSFGSGCLFLVRRHMRPATRRENAELANFTVTNITVLYAVLLAFLTIVTWENFSKASDNASQEAGEIANLYQDTWGLDDTEGKRIRGHLHRYLRNIVEQEWPEQTHGRSPPERPTSLAVLRRAITQLQATTPAQAVLMADMLRDLNEIDSARAERLVSLGGQIPGLVWTLILVMGLLAVGYSAFIVSESVAIHTVMLFGFVLALTMVLVMIMELDSPFEGAISVSVEPYQHALDVISHTASDQEPQSSTVKAAVDHAAKPGHS